MGDDFITVPRLSRIYYNGKFFSYPLEISNALFNLRVVNSLLILASCFQAKISFYAEEKNCEQWVSNRFGQRLYETFFKSYIGKVWGILCTQIWADWADVDPVSEGLAVVVLVWLMLIAQMALPTLLTFIFMLHRLQPQVQKFD